MIDDDDTQRAGAAADATVVVPDLTPTSVSDPLAWSDTEPFDDVDARRTWRSTIGRAAGVLAASGILAVVVAVLIHHGHKHPVSALTPTAQPTSGVVVPRVAAGPDGVYRVEQDMSKATYSGKATPIQDPTVIVAWIAYHTSCNGTGCTMVSAFLNDDRQTARSAPNTWLFRNGQWHNQPTTEFVKCDDGSTQDLTVDGEIDPIGPDGVLRGATDTTAPSDGCSIFKGDLKHSPFVGTRIGDVPPGVLNVDGNR